MLAYDPFGGIKHILRHIGCDGTCGSHTELVLAPAGPHKTTAFIGLISERGWKNTFSGFVEHRLNQPEAHQ